MSTYLNRPLRTEAQAERDRAELRANLRAVHIANATQTGRTPFEPIQDDAPAPAATVGTLIACLILSACLALGIGFFTGIVEL